MKLISESKFAGKTCPKQQLFNRTHKNGSITAHNKPAVEEDKELNEQMVGARIEWKTHTHTRTLGIINEIRRTDWKPKTEQLPNFG